MVIELPVLDVIRERGSIRRYRDMKYGHFSEDDVEYIITNPSTPRGVKEMYVDGERIEGNLIKPHGDGQVHKVRAVLG